MEIKDIPIEILGLGDNLTNYLKLFYIYTVEQLAAKTRSDLVMIRLGFQSISLIEAKVLEISKIGLRDNIEPEDQIERLELPNRVYNPLKKAGISRISDLMRLSKLEIFSMRGIEEDAYEAIQQKLKERLGEEFITSQYVSRVTNKKDVSIGYVVMSITYGMKLRKKGIYTIRELLRIPEQQMLKESKKFIITDIKTKLSDLDESFVLGSEPKCTELQSVKELKENMAAQKQSGGELITKLEGICAWMEPDKVT